VAHHHPNGTREQINLAGPSLLPVSAAVGIATALMGLALVNRWFVPVGGLILLVTAVRWIGAVREEVDSLPSERR
jgi:hypothetical protein